MYEVTLTPDSLEDLREIREYITRTGSQERADRYLAQLEAFCEGLAIAPMRGEDRWQSRPGLRSIGFGRRVSVFFIVSVEEQRVEVLNFRYGGRQIQ